MGAHPWLNPIMSTPTTLATDQVTNLEFQTLLDELKPGQWNDYGVSFTYNGKEYFGCLQSCPHHVMVDTEITEIEEA